MLALSCCWINLSGILMVSKEKWRKIFPRSDQGFISTLKSSLYLVTTDKYRTARLLLHLISMIHTLLLHVYVPSELLMMLEWCPIKCLWASPSSLPRYYGGSLKLGWTIALCLFPWRLRRTGRRRLRRRCCPSTLTTGTLERKRNNGKAFLHILSWTFINLHDKCFYILCIWNELVSCWLISRC